MSASQKNRMEVAFQLLKGLNRKEVSLFRYLEKFSPQKSSLSKFLEVIESQKEFSLPEIEIILRKNGISEKQQRELANTLFFQIVRVIRYYGNSPNSNIYTLIDSIDILARNGQYASIPKLVRVAKKKAREKELIEIEIQLCRKEIELLYRSPNFKLIELQRKNAEAKELRNILENLFEYYTLYELALELIDERWIKASGKSEIFYKERIGFLESHPMLASEDSALSIAAKSVFLNIKMVLYRYRKDWDAFLQTSGKVVDLVQKHPFLMEKQPEVILKNSYFSALIAIERGKMDSFESSFKQIKEFKSKGENLKGIQRFRESFLSLLVSWRYRNTDQAIDVCNSILSDSGFLKYINPFQASNILLLSAIVTLGTPSPISPLSFINLLNGSLANRIPVQIDFVSRLIQILALVKDGKFELASDRFGAMQKFVYRKMRNREGWNEIKKLIHSLLKLEKVSDRKMVFGAFYVENARNKSIVTLSDPFELLLYCKAESEDSYMAEVKSE